MLELKDLGVVQALRASSKTIAARLMRMMEMQPMIRLWWNGVDCDDSTLSERCSGLPVSASRSRLDRVAQPKQL